MTESEQAYYEKRAPEYDDWYYGAGLYANRTRPGWHEEVRAMTGVVRSFPLRPLVDVACGTAFLTPPGGVAVDRSHSMLKLASRRAATVVQGDAMRLPFPDRAFQSLLSGHFYGHLREADRARFLAEARRVAARILIVDAAVRPDIPPDDVQDRVLSDGSRHTLYKRYFTPTQLLSELGGGSVLHAGEWFVAVLTA